MQFDESFPSHKKIRNFCNTETTQIIMADGGPLSLRCCGLFGLCYLEGVLLVWEGRGG